MSEEEHSSGAIEDGDGDMDAFLARRYRTRHQKLASKNKTTLDIFLGKGSRVHEVGIVPRYYGELLAWALRRHMDEEGWQTVQTLGYRASEPVHIDVNTDCGRRENLLIDGQLLLEKGTNRLVVTVDVNMRGRNSLLVEGSAKRKEQVRGFVTGVIALARDQNFYRGKKLEFGSRIRFLEVNERSWESVILEEKTKKEIRANTIGFLNGKEWCAKYGIPTKRGLLLAGEPGTGKTIICKALMAEAEDLTCIASNAYVLDADEYLTELYELAEDLSPCIVFIEDVDLIGQNRDESGYPRGPALLSLLSALDGIEEQRDIVTVATTNCLETLDRALSRRPSRFDRVVKLAKPDFGQRLEIVSRLCRKIPLSVTQQRYVAGKTEGCTPAQVQEIIYSLAIEHHGEPLESSFLEVGREDIDYAISRINGRRAKIGFGASDVWNDAGSKEQVLIQAYGQANSGNNNQGGQAK